jgi:hypothetical protein
MYKKTEFGNPLKKNGHHILHVNHNHFRLAVIPCLAHTECCDSLECGHRHYERWSNVADEGNEYHTSNEWMHPFERIEPLDKHLGSLL